jgi:hypothetical protein
MADELGLPCVGKWQRVKTVLLQEKSRISAKLHFPHFIDGVGFSLV